jgi:hypothetical protein
VSGAGGSVEGSTACSVTFRGSGDTANMLGIGGVVVLIVGLVMALAALDHMLP